jgi:hypothetical protein
MDNDRDVDVDDIQAFVLGLTSPVEYQNQFGFAPFVNGDMDADGDLDFDDVDDFAAQLAGGSTSVPPRPVPEASRQALGLTALVGWILTCGRRIPEKQWRSP